MRLLVATLLFHLGRLGRSEEGQDLVEYALVVALIGFGSIAGMSFLATGINNAFSAIATTLTTDV